MKKILFICNTYYQLIAALQMRLTIMAEDECFVLITDRSKNACNIANNLKQTEIFKDVYFQEVKEFKRTNPTFFEKLRLVYCGVFGSKAYNTDNSTKFDSIIGFNLDIHTHIIYAKEKQKNPKLICEKMEEGLLSYATPDSSCDVLKLIYLLRRILKRDNLKEHLTEFYCFEPNAYNGKLKTVEIPKLNSASPELIEILNSLFFSDNVECDYRQKYIYLPCIYDIEGGEPIGELDLAIKIAALVGKENLIVKVHPRDDTEKYRAAGLNVAENSAVPWEVIQINSDFSEKTLISTLSGSLLTTVSLFKNPPKCCYLYKMCKLNNNSLATHFAGVIENYINNSSNSKLKNIKICKDINEIL